MKRLISIFTIVLLIAVAASAGVFSGKRFYVNPGHGGHDSNDRPTPMPLGVAMFYESDGNLSRGLALRNFLTSNGGTVKMSRTTNYSSDDLGLSTIASQANSYGGYFLCLHTNAANAKANYIISFYRGYPSSSNSYEVVPPSKSMGLAVSKWHMNNKITNTTYDTPRSVSDYAFNGWNYGVLRTNNRPGYLVETFFHDYRPEGLRMKSDTYNRYLAWQVARALLDSPGCSGVFKGCIIGDIRDLNKSCGYSDYATRGRDSKYAVNGATVSLKNGSGSVVKTFTTDNCANGFYAFFNLEPGSYTVEVAKNGYITKRSAVTVKDNASTLCNFDMQQGVDSGISPSASLLDFGIINAGTTASKTVTVTARDITANISVSSTNPVFAVTPASLPATGGKLTVTYNPNAAGSHSGYIKLAANGKTASISVEGVAKNPPLIFTEGWNFSETSGKNESWTADKGKMRNFDYSNGKLYVVNAVDGKIMVVNAQTGKYIKDLDMTGVSEGALKIIDCKCVGDRIFGCNLGTAKDPFKVYVWENMDAAPRVLLNTNNIGGQSRIGDCMNIRGDLAGGTMSFAAGGSNEPTKVIAYTIKDGVCNSTPTVTQLKTDEGKDIILGLSPRVIPEASGKYWAMGQNYYPSLFTADAVLQTTLNPKALLNEYAGNSFKAFTFKGTSYGIATTYTPAKERLKDGRIVLVDATDGWAQAENIGEYPSAGLGKTRNTSFSTSVAVSVNGDKGVEMWVLVHNQGIAYFKHGTPKTHPDEPGTPVTTLTASATSLDFNAQKGTSQQKKFTVTGANLTEDITLSLSGVNADLFELSQTTVSKAAASATITVTYSPVVTGVHTATVNINTAGASKEVALKGISNDEINADVVLAEKWNFSQTSGKTANWVTFGKPVTLDMAFAGDKLYVVHRTDNSDNKINIVDAYTGVKKGELNVSACTRGTYLISSIENMGGKIIACNLATGAASPLVVYKWDNDASAPEILLETTSHIDSRTGDAMSVDGTLEDGKIVFAFGNRVFYYPVKNGKASADPVVINLTRDGKAYDYNEGTPYSNVTFENDGTFWIASKGKVPAHFRANGEFFEEIPNNAIGASQQGTDIKILNVGNKKYAFVSTYLNKSAKSIADGAISVVDITDGMNVSAPKQIIPANGLGGSRNTLFRNTICLHCDKTTIHVWGLVPFQGALYTAFESGYTSVENIEDGKADCLIFAADNMLNIMGVDAAAADIYSVNGSVVLHAENENIIDVSNLTSGIYVVVVFDKSGRKYVARVVK